METERNVQFKLHPKYNQLTIGSDGSVYDNSKDTYLKYAQDSRGFYYIYHDGQRLLVHRLVADCYLANPKGYRFVVHKDLDKRHNDISNLEWSSSSSYKAKMNLNYNGGQRVPIGTCTEDGQLLCVFLGYDQAISMGYSKSGIAQAIRCHCRHKGDYWRYVSKSELAARNIDTTGYRFYRKD